jgi:hypothetical protein
MAKGFERSGSSWRGPEGAPDPREVMIQKLGELVSDMYLCTDESDLKRMWSSARRMMVRLNVEEERLERILSQRRIGALSTLATELAASAGSGGEPAKPLMTRAELEARVEASQGPPPPDSTATPHAVGPAEVPVPVPVPVPAPAPVTASSVPAAAAPAAHVLQSAMKAFKKRLKLTRLDQESRLGHGPMSGGRRSAVVAIQPPREYPRAVWEELVRQGKLRDAGGGFYELSGQ